MTQIVERTILFGDLRGSTALYETLGNAEATSVVTHSVSMLANIVPTFGGTVERVAFGVRLRSRCVGPGNALCDHPPGAGSPRRLGVEVDGIRREHGPSELSDLLPPDQVRGSRRVAATLDRGVH